MTDAAHVQTAAAPRPHAGTTTAGARLSGLALLGWVGFILLLVYATFLGGGYVGTQAVPLRMLSLLLVALVLIVWAVLAWRRPSWRPLTAIWPAVVLPLAALAITTFVSPLPRLGLEYLAWAVLLFALYLLLVRIMALPAARERMGGVAALLGFIVGIAYVVLVGGAWLDWWALLGTVAMPMLRPAYAALTFGGPNIVAPVMILLAAAAFGGIRPATRVRRIVLLLLGVLTLIVVLLAASRASWLAFAATVMLVGAALLITNSARLPQLAEDRRWRLAGVGALVVAVPLVLIAAPAVLSRLSVAGDGGRSSYFTAALRMFEDSPLTGAGTGTWAVLRASNTEPGEVDWYVNHAHNVYLQTLAEMGLVGAVTGIITLVAVGWLLWRGLRTKDADRRRWAWAALFGLLYLGLHSMLDFYANMPVVMMVAAIPVAALDATSRVRLGIPGLSKRAAGLARRGGQAALFIVAALAVIVLFRTESIASAHQEALLLAADGEWQQASDALAPVVAADPEMIPYLATSGSVASALGDWQVAHDAYLAAATVDDLPANWLGLAQAQIALGMPASEAAISLERALRLGAGQPNVAYAAGHLYDRLGLSVEADAAYATAISLRPSLAADPSWHDDPELSTRYPALIDAAIEVRPQGWQVAMISGDAERAGELNAASGDDPDVARIIAAWYGSDDALAEIRAIAEARPRDGAALAWAARLSARAGDADAAARYRELMTFVDEVGAVADEVRVGGLEPQEDVVTARRTDLYGQMLYRRPLPVDLLAPGLPRLVYARE